MAQLPEKHRIERQVTLRDAARLTSFTSLATLGKEVHANGGSIALKDAAGPETIVNANPVLIMTKLMAGEPPYSLIVEAKTKECLDDTISQIRALNLFSEKAE